MNAKTNFSSGFVQSVDYIPSGAVSAGDVVIINGVLYIAPADIAANTLGALVFSGGTWGGNKAAGGWTLGKAVYYDTAASPNVGTASSGAYTQTPSATTVFAGYAVLSPPTQLVAATGDQLGYFVKANSAAAGTGGGYQSVAATGSSRTDGAALALGFNFGTAADGTKGVVLPTGAVAGATVEVKNSDAANAILKVYPNTGTGTINALSAGAAISMAAKTAATFKCQGSDVWITIPLLPS